MPVEEETVDAVHDPKGSTRICPNCGGHSFKASISVERIRRESAYRKQFVMERFVHQPKPYELKDLTDFAHSNNSAILACAECGVFMRDEPASESECNYIEDAYDTALIDRLFPRYVAAFRAKHNPYRSLLPSGSRVLEIGSHYGAFLQVASEWGWQPIGVDIGRDTSEYAKSKGYLIFNKELSECAFPANIFDGVFVWNCFEQVAQPRPLLDELRRIVKPGGLLVVRTPNALFYQACERLLQHAAGGREEFAFKAMAYNNLLAFPYLYGYQSANLNALVSREGFRLEGRVNSELLTLPLPETPEWVAQEEHELHQAIERMNASASPNSRLTGPWIELYYRTEA